MRGAFLHRFAGASRLLIVFNGWGMDDTLFSTWEKPDFDVYTVCDYTEIAALPEFSGYGEIGLVAWSLGVRAAAEVIALRPLPLTGTLAVNGTLRPVEAQYGIAPAVFHGTAVNWEHAAARANFFRRLAGKTPEHAYSARTWEDQKNELAALETRYTAQPPPENCFTAAITGAADRIIPAASQWNYWSFELAVAYREIPDAPHDITGLFGSFKELYHAVLG